MGLGITRDLLGDILVGEDTAQVVCLASALPILLEQWREVGRYSASPKGDPPFPADPGGGNGPAAHRDLPIPPF